LEDVSNLEAEAKAAEDENYLYSMFDLVEAEPHAKPEKKESRELPAVCGCVRDTDEVITCNDVPMVVTKTPEKKSEGPECDHVYVYDVYTMGKPLRVDEQHVDVEHLYDDDELAFEQEESEEEKHDEEDEDSNDENNPNNSYPEDENSNSSMASCEEKYYGFEEPDLYNWSGDDDEEVYGDADEEGGSRAMKELAKHLQETGLNGRSESEGST
jgi:hypothetical protein